MKQRIGAILFGSGMVSAGLSAGISPVGAGLTLGGLASLLVAVS